MRSTSVAALAASIGHRMARSRARRWIGPRHAIAAQWHEYATLNRMLAATAYGRSVGWECGIPYEQFRLRVPTQAYEGFAPWIERLKHGEADVLHPGWCPYFAVSSGTTAGTSKWLPVNAAMLRHFRSAGLDSLALYARSAGHSRIFGGRHLFLGGSTGLVPVAGAKKGALAGDLSGITALNLPWWVDRALYEPGRNIAQLDDWPTKLFAIAERTWSRDIRLVAGIPSWLLLLAGAVGEAYRGHSNRTAMSLREIWPNLECLVHGGVPVGPFIGELAAAFGPGVRRHEVYPASEGFIAAQDHEDAEGLRLLAHRGIFYEFIPAAAFDASNPTRSATAAVPLEGVTTGADYVLVMTTPAGLVRYVIGDVVRFLSVDPPRLVYVGRTKLQLSAFGEHVIEKELTDALVTAGEAMCFAVTDFHVAPLFPVGHAKLGQHEWWIELNGTRGLDRRPDSVTLAATLDQILCTLNDDYAGKRRGNGLAMPIVRFVPPGTFERWLKAKGRWGGQNKTPRCRSDRQMADGLAELMRPSP